MLLCVYVIMYSLIHYCRLLYLDMSVLLECVGYTLFELRLNVYEYIKSD